MGVVVRTPEQGLAEFRQLSGFAEALDVLAGQSAAERARRFAVSRSQATESPALLEELKADPRVDMVQYDAAWRQRLSAILDFGERAMQALTILLGLGHPAGRRQYRAHGYPGARRGNRGRATDGSQ